MVTQPVPEVLYTPRLVLRPWQSADQPALAAINADPRVAEFLPSTLDRAQSDALMQRLQATIDTLGYGYWAAQLRASGELVGFIGLRPCPPDMPFLPGLYEQLLSPSPDEIAAVNRGSGVEQSVIGELGWRLATRFWGQGLASEGAMAAAQYGLRQQRMPAVVAFTAVQNQRSLAVMRRLRMRAAGWFDHPALGADSPLRAHRWMVLTAADLMPSP